MRDELSEKLIKGFPELYRIHGYGDANRPFPVGFGVGDGWFKLLWDLSEKITTHLKKTFVAPKPNEDWQEKDYYILHPLGMTITDIKEKFAGLRYYYSGGDDLVSKWVDEAENKSYTICEVCGNPGCVVSSGSWLSTRCDGCMKPGEKKLEVNNEKDENSNRETD